MSGWALVWYVVILTAIISYFGLAVVLSIGGFFDVKKMFRRLAEAHRRATAQQDAPVVTTPKPPGESGGDARGPQDVKP